MSRAQRQYSSPIGSLFLVASDQGLQGLFWNDQSLPLENTLATADPKKRILNSAVQQLEEYFDGRRTDFDLPLDLMGTSFRKQVWAELLKIPFGKTLSYSDLARRLKNEKAVRAVGSANGKNPLCIIVPCHRVIAADGSLGGYSGGLERKSQLLALEKRATLS